MKLDKTDRRILDVLQRDGRISVTDLAEQVGLSPTPCARRIRQLETSGLIQGYAAIVDPKRAGQTIQAIVQIKLEQHSDEIVERFRRTLIDRPEVLACYTMTGEMDFLLHVIVRDIEALVGLHHAPPAARAGCARRDLFHRARNRQAFAGDSARGTRARVATSRAQRPIDHVSRHLRRMQAARARQPRKRGR